MDPSYYERIKSSIGDLENYTGILKLYKKQCRAMVAEFIHVSDNLTNGPNGDSATKELNFKELFRLKCEAERVLANCCCEQWLQAAVLQSDRTIFKIIRDDLKSCLGTLSETGNSFTRELKLEEDEWTAQFDSDQDLRDQLDEIERENRRWDLLIVGLLRARLNNNEVEHVFAGLADDDRQDGCALRVDDRSPVMKITLLGIELAEKSFHSADEFRKEVEVMAKLNHPNVVRFIGCTLEGGAGRNQPAIFMELEETCLEKYLQERRRQEMGERWSSQGLVDNRAGPLLPPSVAVDIMMQVALGMAYLHSQNIVHGDLKPANLLLTSCTEHEFPRVKIADFGLSRKVEGQITIERISGTTVYMAPEVFNVGSKSCLKKADVYCFGMTCWQILHCQNPRLTTMAPITCLDHVLRCRGPQIEYVKMVKMGEEVAKGTRLKIHPDIPPHLRHLIEVCWRTNPDDRPIFSVICLFLQAYKASLLGSSLSVHVLDVFPSVQQNRSMFGRIRKATKSLMLRILPSPREDGDEFIFPGDELRTSREGEQRMQSVESEIHEEEQRVAH